MPALALLFLAWWQLQRLAAARRLTGRTAALVAAAWALPFAVGPVLGSRDAYAYVAQGELGRRGLDPTESVVSQLGPGPLLDAVDPRWRETRPPYGGVAIAIQKAAAAGDRNPAVSLLVLRLVALAAVVLIVLLTAQLVDPARRPFVLVMLGANPLVLVHLVAGMHLDAVAAALLVVALVLTRGKRIRSDLLRRTAVMACTFGALVKLPVGLGVAYLVVGALVLSPPGRRWRLLAGDVLTAAAAVGVSIAISGAGLGWLHNFGTPGRLRTGIAPADLVANVAEGAGWLVGVHLDASSVLGVTRAVCLALAVVWAAWMVLPRRGPCGHWNPPTPGRLGLALLGLGLLGPVLYAWYLAPALPLLAVAASRTTGTVMVRARRPQVAQWTAITLSVLLTFAAVPTLLPAWHLLGAHPEAIAALAAVAVSGVVGLATWMRRRAVSPTAPPVRLPEPSLTGS